MIVGGVLTGQSLISAAEVRAQISQIGKYQTAVNTFKSKYNAIPGDMDKTTAAQYGFTVGAGCNGQMGGRDGNGLIDGYAAEPFVQGAGETELFWQDISSSVAGNLIDSVFPNSGTQAPVCGSSPNLTGTQISSYFPAAKIGHGNYLYVYENSGFNWYGLSSITALTLVGNMNQSFSVPVVQAYNMDAKVDDGLPLGGNIQAQVVGNVPATMKSAPNTTTSGGTSSSCYDTTTGTYSITVNNGNGGNCALSFKFQ